MSWCPTGWRSPRPGAWSCPEASSMRPTASGGWPSWRSASRRVTSARGTCPGSHGSDHAPGAGRADRSPSTRPGPAGVRRIRLRRGDCAPAAAVLRRLVAAEDGRHRAAPVHRPVGRDRRPVVGTVRLAALGHGPARLQGVHHPLGARCLGAQPLHRDGQPGRVGALLGLAAAAVPDLVDGRRRRGGARRRVLARRRAGLCGHPAAEPLLPARPQPGLPRLRDPGAWRDRRPASGARALPPGAPSADDGPAALLLVREHIDRGAPVVGGWTDRLHPAWHVPGGARPRRTLRRGLSGLHRPGTRLLSQTVSPLRMASRWAGGNQGPEITVAVIDCRQRRRRKTLSGNGAVSPGWDEATSRRDLWVSDARVITAQLTRRPKQVTSDGPSGPVTFPFTDPHGGRTMTHLWNRLWKLHARVLRRVSHYHWFGVLGKHVVSPIDRAVIRASRGRLSMTGPEFTTMLLTTTGRKSGKQRTIPVYYVRDGKKLVAVCENFGLKTASSWPKN